MASPKFIQIAVGQWRSQGSDSLSFSVVGLTAGGDVFKFEKSNGWVPLEDAGTASAPASYPRVNRRAHIDEDISF